IGSQMVHERFTTGEERLAQDQQSHLDSDSNNNANIGSQMVHERFTTGEERLAQDQQSHLDSDSNNNGNIGSQMVHERFTTEEGRLTENQRNHSDSDSSNNANIGSQLVHERFTIGERGLAQDQQNHSESESNNNAGIGSQLVHTDINNVSSEFVKKPQISFSKLVGNQRAILIALYKNIKINKSDSTDELTLELISEIARVNQKSLKNTLFRLTNAGVLIRVDQKVGRGGWVKYKINSEIIKEIQQKEFFR
ncbi:hypothetical protein, partial [Legionella pneumophila]